MSPDEPPAERLRDAAVALSTTDPAAGLDDLRPLVDVFADRRIVGLGEATHGTREFFRLKHRLVRLLIEELGLRLVGFEAPFAETLALDDYVTHGEGDPREGLDGLGLWVHRTEAVLAFLEWLRAFNEGRDPGDRVRLYGIDVQHTGGAAAALVDYLGRVDPDYLREVRDGLSVLERNELHPYAETAGEPTWADLDPEARFERAERLVDSIDGRVSEREAAYVAVTSEREFRLVRRHVWTLARALAYQRAQAADDVEASAAVRDRAMAENATWLLAYTDAETIALWAHNGHVRRGENRGDWGATDSMGEHLHREHGDDYYAVGFDFGAGSFRAARERDDGYELAACSLDDPLDGSLSATLGALEASTLFLDLDAAREDPVLDDWFDREHRLHDVGATFDPAAPAGDYFERYDTSRDLDGIVFVGASSRARPLE